MIKTVTMNAAVDKTVEINNFSVGAVNRISAIRLDAGGKGINVTKVIKVLQGQSQALGILAGNNGRYIKTYLDNIGIANDFVFTAGETRTNMKIVDMLNHTHTDVNEPGSEVSAYDLEKLEKKIFNDLDQDNILVLSGSVPLNTPSDLYQKWICNARKAGSRTILDADGQLLQEGLKAAPDVIKPNIHELERLLNRKILNLGDTVAAARSLLDLGIGMIVVSMGEEGAVFVQKEQTIRAAGLQVDVKSTVGAGDSMVAALALALDNNYPIEKTVALSVAASGAQVMTPGTQPPKLLDVLELERLVSLEYI